MKLRKVSVCNDKDSIKRLYVAKLVVWGFFSFLIVFNVTICLSHRP